MNLWLRRFILGVVTSLATAKRDENCALSRLPRNRTLGVDPPCPEESYSLPYEASGDCRDRATEYHHENRCCSKCRSGTRLAHHCTRVRDTVCEACPDGRFSDSMNYYPNCFTCTTCREEKGMMYRKQCSRDSNAECECKSGWYCISPDEPCTACEKHKTCGPGKGAISPGTATSNVKCGDCPNGTFSADTSTQPCQPHTRCELLGRSVLLQGTAISDTVCDPSVIPRPSPTHNLPITTKASALSTETSIKPPIVESQPTSEITAAVISTVSSGIRFIGLWIGLTVAVPLVVLLIAGFCIYHRKALLKPPVQDGIEAGQNSNLAISSSPGEKLGLLTDSSTDPSMSSSSDSHSQGTGVSQDCLHVDPTPVSSPVLNVSITATINCQVNPATGSCTIPISPCVHLPEPDFPLSQEEELCKSCEQEDSKDAIQSVQESGMTKY